MTKDKPVRGLALKYDFEKRNFHFDSNERAEEKGHYIPHVWLNEYDDTPWQCNDSDIVFSVPRRVEETDTLVYNEIITPYPLSLDDLVISMFGV